MTNLIISTLPATLKILLPILYILVLFSISGLYLFSGTLDNRCRIKTNDAEIYDGSWPVDKTQNFLCKVGECKEGTYCINPWDYNIMPDKSERDIKELSFGVIHYDNIKNAIISNWHYLMIT